METHKFGSDEDIEVTDPIDVQRMEGGKTRNGDFYFCKN